MRSRRPAVCLVRPVLLQILAREREVMLCVLRAFPRSYLIMVASAPSLSYNLCMPCMSCMHASRYAFRVHVCSIRMIYLPLDARMTRTSLLFSALAWNLSSLVAFVFYMILSWASCALCRFLTFEHSHQQHHCRCRRCMLQPVAEVFHHYFPLPNL